MNKAIFLDRDGTIIVDKKYSFLPETIQFIDGVIPALRKLSEQGFLLIIITNQSGVARGLFTEKNVLDFNNELVRLLRKENIPICACYYCPHHPQGVVEEYSIHCDCRKPGIELFLNAVKDYDIDLAKSYAIGDRMRDCAICEVSSCKGCVITQTVAIEGHQNIQIFNSFAECVEYILKEGEL